MSAAPAVSINTCCHNSSRFIGETIDSVLRQTMTDFQWVIVDDGSTDGTPELIEQRRDPRITLVRQQHITLRFARSIALAHSTGAYIAFLDSDDLWQPDKLERQLAIAREAGPALLCGDADLIDERSQVIGRFSDEFGLQQQPFNPSAGYFELLRRGNFIASPTAFVLTKAIRDLGGFNHDYRHVNDFDLWLRLARRHPVVYQHERLAQYRVHHAQFTQRRMDITLPEQRALLDPIVRSSSYPVDVRTSLGDNMLGQHRLAARVLARQRRPMLALRAWAGQARYPDRWFDSVRHRLRGSIAGSMIEVALRGSLRVIDITARARVNAVVAARRIRNGGIQSRLRRAWRGAPQKARDGSPQHHVLIDGTCLHKEQAGYFNLLVETVRRLMRDDCVIHIIANRAGRSALLERIPEAVDRVGFHPAGWRTLHWMELKQLLTGSKRDGRIARLIRIAWRWLPQPRWRASYPNAIEVLFWRGRYRWKNSLRIAVVQDMTTRLHPEWHTAPNVREFDEFLRYAQQHAHHLVTVSECSRQDIINAIAVPPSAVSVLPMPINPQFHRPSFLPGWLTLHRITQPYVLCVGTIEPRKNLRRLVQAFELLRESDACRHHLLVLVGAHGWDSGFDEFLAASDVTSRVIRLGFVPTDHLPSLYHYASAVVQPSLYEGFGIPVMEAMCSSAVVIASNRGALPGVLGPGGVTFDPTDSHAIAGALLWALTLNAEQAAAYRQRCRANAEAHLRKTAEEPLIPGLPPDSRAVSV